MGSVKGVGLNPDNTVDVTFDVDDRYQLYTSTRAVVRYQNLVGDRYLEITSGPGDLRKLSEGATIPKENTQPALDLDALLGGLRPVLKGLDGNKVNEVSNAIIELLQGQGGSLSTLLSSTSAFTQDLSARDQLIGDTINNLNTVLGDHRREGRAVRHQCERNCSSSSPASPRTATRSRGAIPPARLGDQRPDRSAAQQQTTGAGRHREHPTVRPADGRAQGRRQQGPRAARRETICGSTPLAPTGRSSTSTTARSASRSTARRAATS